MDHSILAEGLVKRFGATIALDGVDLRVRTGTVLGLTGPYAVDEKLTGGLLGMSRKAARSRAAELITDFRLGDAASRAVKTYPGGMRRLPARRARAQAPFLTRSGSADQLKGTPRG